MRTDLRIILLMLVPAVAVSCHVKETRNKTNLKAELPVIEETIRAAIGWAKDKDFSLFGTYGVDSAIAEYNRILKEEAENYRMDESELNKLGIELCFKHKMTAEALKIFEVNMLQFPHSYNTYDSYAYVLMQRGDYVNSTRY